MANIKQLDEAYNRARAAILDDDGNLAMRFADGPTVTLGPRAASSVAMVVEILQTSLDEGVLFDAAGMSLYEAAKAYHNAIEAVE